MRYIGSKEPILDFLQEKIISTVGDVRNKVFGDLFAGTCSVSILFKKMGAKLIVNDYMAYSFVLANAYIKINQVPEFNKLTSKGLNGYLNIIQHLNNLPLKNGFFYKNYSLEGSNKANYVRNYFSANNAKKIDAISDRISAWDKMRLITLYERHFLRASLIEAVTKVSNTSGTYGAFLKIDDKRKHKLMTIKPITIIPSNNNHQCYNEDIRKIVAEISGDILYLDPPYNQRQYPPYYHILETIALNDLPNIYGKTGRRPYKDKLSPFCMKDRALKALEEVINKAKFAHIFLSYNSEGIIPIKEIAKMLNKYGAIKEFIRDHRRYKSNSNSNNKTQLREVLYYVKKK